MRFLIAFALVVLVQPAFADDEFGARFGSNSTAAFEDATTDPAKALSEIMPAAGEESEPATAENKPTGASPEDDKSDEVQTQINEFR